MAVAAQNDWLLWQLADSAFPTGSFAHSGGLESAVQNGELRGACDLGLFLEAALDQCASACLPFVAAVYDEPDKICEVDSMCDAFTSNHVANRASRLQGRAFLLSCSRAFTGVDWRELKAHLESSPTHLPPVFGAIACMLALERLSTLRVYVYSQLRSWISSAVRLGIVGPLEAQNIQASFAGEAERVVNRGAEATLEEIAQTAPLIDLLQGTQDRLYSRLFQS